ncbi:MULTISPECIES: hypothetical protein [Microbacterium]|uniref:hypothetical protein n=1 Tax=Microbacterium TaxID=33882 RepID=UPI001EF5AA7F|nr:hypothetical protein [Microbacterium aurum]MCG7415005.1 hypothetical protein [Microbacterium aurum]
MKAIVGTIAGLLIGLLVGALVGPMLVPRFFGSSSESRDSQVITAIAREEQVVLLSLGVQGLHTKDANSQLLGVVIPWSDRTSILEYSFTAKLGIEGGDVKIEPAGENNYRITIPKFIFIGHQNENFRLAEEKDGVLSWITPDFDTADLITEILNDDAKDEYVAKNLEDLHAQAEVFYRGIVTGIDPDITLTFDFV